MCPSYAKQRATTLQSSTHFSEKKKKQNQPNPPRKGWHITIYHKE